MKYEPTRGRPSPARQMLRFLRDDAGAVTVDWIVLTAAIVMLGMVSGFIVTSAVPGVATQIKNVVESQTVVPE